MVRCAIKGFFFRTKSFQFSPYNSMKNCESLDQIFFYLMCFNVRLQFAHMLPHPRLSVTHRSHRNVRTSNGSHRNVRTSNGMKFLNFSPGHELKQLRNRNKKSFTIYESTGSVWKKRDVPGLFFFFIFVGQRSRLGFFCRTGRATHNKMRIWKSSTW